MEFATRLRTSLGAAAVLSLVLSAALPSSVSADDGTPITYAPSNTETISGLCHASQVVTGPNACSEPRISTLPPTNPKFCESEAKDLVIYGSTREKGGPAFDAVVDGGRATLEIKPYLRDGTLNNTTGREYKDTVSFGPYPYFFYLPELKKGTYTYRLTYTGGTGVDYSGTPQQIWVQFSPSTFDGLFTVQACDAAPEKCVAAGPPLKPVNPATLNLSNVNFALLSAEDKMKWRRAMLGQWRKANPKASPSEFAGAARDISELFENNGKPKGWLERAFDSVRNSSNPLARSAVDMANFVSTVHRIRAGALNRDDLTYAYSGMRGVWNGAKHGLVSAGEAVLAMPSAAGVAFKYYESTSASQVCKDFKAVVPEMTAATVDAIKAKVSEFNGAAARGDYTRLSEIIGSLGGEVEAQVMIAGMLKAVGSLRRGSGATGEGASLEGVVQEAETTAEAGGAATGAGKLITARAALESGYEPFVVDHIQAVAQREGVIVEMRPGNPESLPRIVNHEAVPKAEAIKANTITDTDVLLGAKPDSGGLVGFFKPAKPPNFAELAADSPLRKRYDMRMQQWNDYGDLMRQLEVSPELRTAEFNEKYGRMVNGQRIDLQIKVKDGIVYDRASSKPFAGDYDIYALKDAQGNLLSPERANEVLQKLGYASDPQHGGLLNWQTKTAADQYVKDATLWKHSPANPDGQMILRFGGQDPVFAWGHR